MDYILKESLTERALGISFGETLVERALMDCVSMRSPFERASEIYSGEALVERALTDYTPQSSLSWLLSKSIRSLSGSVLAWFRSRTITTLVEASH